MTRREHKLKNLVLQGCFKSYEIKNLDSNGEEGVSENRNTEQLTLEFANGAKLIIDTFCSGCAEDTTLDISTTFS